MPPTTKFNNVLVATLSLGLVLVGPVASAQTITYPKTPLTYPMTSNNYEVEYKNSAGVWTSAKVYQSYYGYTDSSPYASYSNYPQGMESMSFVSIPAKPSSTVELRVAVLGELIGSWSSVGVRPAAKSIPATVEPDGTIQVHVNTPSTFAGEQFILWWNMDSFNSGGVEGLAVFLTPSYSPPTGKVLNVHSAADLKVNLAKYNSISFDGTVSIGTSGAHALVIPPSIEKVYFAPGSWVQGKLAFQPNGGSTRYVYGSGVLDVSRFNYGLRLNAGEQGFPALTTINKSGSHGPLQNFNVQGITISDANYFATDLFLKSSLNDVKVITWNGNNDGLELGDNSTATNVFVRSGDDSIKVWGDTDTVKNATVWQNYNGGCVNLGWFDNSPGTHGLIDGLFVVKTDWFTPTSPSWVASDKDILEHQNNAVIASCMVPGTEFGPGAVSTYKNIFVDERPWVLFSLKIIPPALYNPARFASLVLTNKSALELDIENVVAPESFVDNSIGFQTVPKGYDFYGHINPATFTLNGKMAISLKNVAILSATGVPTLLTSANAGSVGRIFTNGKNVSVTYGP